jgi:hypothetical protein
MGGGERKACDRAGILAHVSGRKGARGSHGGTAPTVIVQMI